MLADSNTCYQIMHFQYLLSCKFCNIDVCYFTNSLSSNSNDSIASIFTEEMSL
jgi:hypothetical protein